MVCNLGQVALPDCLGGNVELVAVSGSQGDEVLPYEMYPASVHMSIPRGDPCLPC